MSQSSAGQARRADLVSQDLEKPNWGNHEANVRFLEQTGLLRRPRRVLEIGSGKGNLLKHLLDRGHDAVGIDTDRALVAESRRTFPGLPVLVASGVELPFPGGAFDLVLSFDVFEHIPQSDLHLAEVHRVLRADGHYLLQTPNKWTNVLFEPIRFARKYGIANTFEFLKFPHHCALHDYWQLTQRFAENGFVPRFYDVPVVNDFFRDKVRRFLGRPGLLALKVLNPDTFPRALRTNFFLNAGRQESPPKTRS